MAIGNMFKNFQDDEIDPVTGMPFKPSNDPLAGIASPMGMKPADDGASVLPPNYNELAQQEANDGATDEASDAALIAELQAMPGSKNQESPAQDPNRSQNVRDYIMKNITAGKYSDENRQKLLDNSSIGMGEGVLAALSALGAGFQGKDSGAAVQASLNTAKQGKRQAIEDFERGRANQIQDKDLKRKEEQYGRDEEKRAREMDPNSPESKIAQELAVSMGMSAEQAKGLTAAKFQDFSPALQKKYEIEQRKLDRQENRAARAEDKAVRLDEKQQKLQTPYGLAHTEDDAKKLKEAHESKKSFDSKIQEMIDLRKKYGGEVFNREAVARGKQLSKDLLLEYKNMAKLGVLSQSDEKIINAIIPDDPLAFSAASALGQDPILSNLEAFKKDSDKDFATRVQTRTRGGQAPASEEKSSSYPKQVRKDGKVTTVDNAEEEKEANAEGWQ